MNISNFDLIFGQKVAFQVLIAGNTIFSKIDTIFEYVNCTLIFFQAGKVCLSIAEDKKDLKLLEELLKLGISPDHTDEGREQGGHSHPKGRVNNYHFFCNRKLLKSCGITHYLCSSIITKSIK